jgi:N-acylmannosamine kinase
VTVSTGVGGGLVVDGHLQLGTSGLAGHLGHMMLGPSGPACGCGRRRCGHGSREGLCNLAAALDADGITSGGGMGLAEGFRASSAR